MYKLVPVVGFVLTSWVILSHQTQKDIKITNNGYTGITIAISEKVEENEDLIKDIKTAFTEASKLLYTATKKRLYFKNITIVVPKTWSPKADYVNVTGSRFESSPIRIDIPRQDLGLTPYVRGISGCGGQGQYMHLTPDLLSKRQSPYGTHDHIIVHEWAHLRWGVYDEYPTIRDDRSSSNRYKVQFYADGGSWKPVKCTKDIKGFISTTCSKYVGCHLDSSGRPELQCKFCPSSSKTTANASLMGFQWLPSLEQFCDDETESLKHNNLAVNNQNKLCRGRSIWAVIRTNPDFKMTSSGSDQQDTTPIFNILHEHIAARLVLVIDVSGSMKGTPLKNVRDVATDFIMNTAKDGSWMGIVTFSTSAYTKATVRQILSKETREKLVNKLPTSTLSATSIGAGLQKGYEMLKSHFSILQGSVLFLLTDGKENRAPYITDVLPKIVDKGIKVICSAYGANADPKLENLARATGGSTFFFTGHDNSTALFDAFDSVHNDKDLERIYSKVVSITNGVRVNDTFLVDQSNVNELKIRLSLPRNLDVNVSITVTTPDGKNYSSDMRNKYGIPTFKIVDTFMTGEYVISINPKTSTDTTGNIIITTERDSAENTLGNIELSGWLSLETFDISIENKITIFVSVQKGYAPIVHADVVCRIEDGDGGYLQLELKDLGIGNDIEEGDGIYTANVLSTQIKNKGRHSIKVFVSNAEGHAKVLRRDEKLSDDHNIVLKEAQLEKFQREITIDGFTVNGSLSTSTADAIPPADITTLSISAYSSTNQTYTITWLAVGDDYEYGRASRYDVRISQNASLLRNNADSATAIDAPMSPKEAGQIEMFEISLNSTSNTTYYVGIRAIDEESNVGEMSNIISISVITDNQWQPATRESRDDDSSYTTLILIGVGVAALVLIIVIASVVVALRRG